MVTELPTNAKIFFGAGEFIPAPFSQQKCTHDLYYNEQIRQELFTSKSSAQNPLILFSDIVSQLSRLLQIDALTEWTLCYELS